MSQPEVKVSMSVEGLETVKQAFNNLLAESGRFTQQQVVDIRAQAQMQRLIQTDFRLSTQNLREVTGTLKSIGSIGRECVSMWQAYSIAQIRVQDATRDVAEAQANYNQAVRDFGQNSDQATRASKKLEDAQRDLKKAQDDNVAGFISMGAEAVGVVGRVGDLIIQLGKLKDVLEKIEWAKYAGALSTAGYAGVGAAAGFLGAGAIWEATAPAIAKAIGEPAPPHWPEAFQRVWENITSGEAFRWWGEQFNRAFGGGGTVNITINEPTFHSEDDVDRVLDKLVMRLRAEGMVL